MYTEKLLELANLVGNTPMTEIYFQLDGKPKKVYAKLEYFGLTGSIKDRIALNCLKQAYKNGDIKEGYEIAEATSGNTGIAFSAMGSYLGHPVVIFMPDWMTAERKAMISSFGSKLMLVSKQEHGFLGSIQKAKDYAQKGNVYLPRQFENEYNTEAHFTTTGPEIEAQLEKFGVKADGVTAGVGTGGTIMGIGGYLKSKNPNLKIFPMEPANAPVLTEPGHCGCHRIGGISDEFIPQIMKLDKCDNIIQVDDGDAIIMAQMLARKLGLGVGISSGANFISAIKAAEILGGDPVIATVFSDDNKKYLSSDYGREEPVKEGFVSSRVKLEGFKTVK